MLARVASMWGMPLRIATAAMIIDITIGVVTNVIFVVATYILLVAATGRTDLARPALVAVLTGTLAVMGFYAVQRMGIFRWSARSASRLAKAPGSDSLVKTPLLNSDQTNRGNCDRILFVSLHRCPLVVPPIGSISEKETEKVGQCTHPG